jgi:hypothetical protein
MLKGARAGLPVVQKSLETSQGRWVTRSRRGHWRQLLDGIRRQRKWFFGGMPPPAKNQGTDLTVADHVGKMNADRCSGIKFAVSRDVHRLSDGIPKNHAIGGTRWTTGSRKTDGKKFMWITASRRAQNQHRLGVFASTRRA